MPSEHAAILHGRRARGPITLSWVHFLLIVTTLAGLIVTIMVTAAPYQLIDAYYRLQVRQYEQSFGFKVGLVYEYPPQSTTGIWGLASVTPGGRLHRAGARSGDLIHNHHGGGFAELDWVVKEALAGRSQCLVLANVANLKVNEHPHREVCVSADIALPASAR